MPRPKNLRFLEGKIKVDMFKPAGVRGFELDLIEINYDEWEALRLVDYNNLPQEKAAEKMKISQPTLSRILKSVRQKIALALVEGKGIVIRKEY